MFNDSRSYFSKEKSSGGAYSLSEFARMVDVPYKRICARMQKTTNPPEMIMKHGRTRRYRLDDLNKWHETYNG